jgi:hypothetical protein
MNILRPEFTADIIKVFGLDKINVIEKVITSIFKSYKSVFPSKE